MIILLIFEFHAFYLPPHYNNTFCPSPIGFKIERALKSKKKNIRKIYKDATRTEGDKKSQKYVTSKRKFHYNALENFIGWK